MVWLVPIVSAIGLLVALAKLGKSAKRLSRQTSRLNKHLGEFKSTDHQASKAARIFKPGTPEEAVSNRREYLNRRTKNKADRQRRLLKRLRNLTSKESENLNV